MTESLVKGGEGEEEREEKVEKEEDWPGDVAGEHGWRRWG